MAQVLKSMHRRQQMHEKSCSHPRLHANMRIHKYDFASKTSTNSHTSVLIEHIRFSLVILCSVLPPAFAYPWDRVQQRKGYQFTLLVNEAYFPRAICFVLSRKKCLCVFSLSIHACVYVCAHTLTNISIYIHTQV